MSILLIPLPLAQLLLLLRVTLGALLEHLVLDLVLRRLYDHAAQAVETAAPRAPGDLLDLGYI